MTKASEEEKQVLLEQRRELRQLLQELYDNGAPRSETNPIVAQIDAINKSLRFYGIDTVSW